MKAKRKQLSIVWAIFFLVLAECGMRLPREAAEPNAVIPTAEPVVTIGSSNLPPAPFFFTLGSSRTRRALDPVRLEKELAVAGAEQPWVANLSYVGITMPFLYRAYVDELRPLVREHGIDGVLAIEVRGSALNDGYLTSPERLYMKRADFDELPPLPDLLADRADSMDADGPESDDGAYTPASESTRPKADGDLEDSARELLQSLHIVQGRTESLRWIDRHFGDLDDAPEQPGVARTEESIASQSPAVSDSSADASSNASKADATWPTERIASVRAALGEHRSRFTRGSRGFEPIEASASNSHLNIEKWRARYRDELLVDLALGGVQTEMLRRLVAAARQDGLRVVLYLLPITEIHRGFYAPGDYDRMLAFLERLAAHMQVPFVDLDTDHEYTHDDFQDTHHLGPSALDRLSHDFVDRVFLAPPMTPTNDEPSPEER